VVFECPEQRFAYLNLGGAELMLEEASGPGRRFRTAPLEHPYGRGVNFEIHVDDVDAVSSRVELSGLRPYVRLEERWYRQGGVEHGNRQFAVADPDGYLFRFCSDLGRRDVRSAG
jgi:catechol 2,3-dioxygenase-like lactoylglutathione lyase family enzyme